MLNFMMGVCASICAWIAFRITFICTYCWASIKDLAESLEDNGSLLCRVWNWLTVIAYVTMRWPYLTLISRLDILNKSIRAGVAEFMDEDSEITIVGGKNE